MIKQFSAGDITVRPFKTFKHWNIQSVDSASVDSYGASTYYNNKLEINIGTRLNTIFYPSGSQYFDSGSEFINTSGKYGRNVHSLTETMFYKNKQDPLQLFGVERYNQDSTGRQEVRNIHDRVVTATLKHNVWGEKVRPNTIEIIDNSNIHETYKIYDDGYSNLFITGSHFPSDVRLGGVKNLGPTPYWDSASGDFYVSYNNGETEKVSAAAAKEYMDMGLEVSYTPSSGSWKWDTSTNRDCFRPENEHFGESISSWYKYIAVGSSMDQYSLSTARIGYSAIFKYDDAISAHRLVKKFFSPFTQNGLADELASNNSILRALESGDFLSLESLTNSSSYFEDTFGYSVAIRDNFFAVGAPSGSICESSGSYSGFVYVYDRYKGGSDNWGLINILEGGSNDDRFGHAVAIDGDTLAVGAPNVSGSGVVYIFKRKRYMDSDSCYNVATSSFWQEVSEEQNFCSQLETELVDGTSSLLWSERATPTFISGNYTWIYETFITSSQAQSGDKFGWSVEVSGNRIAVGTNKAGSGYASVFTCSFTSASIGACPTASWTEYNVLRGNDLFGDLDQTSPLYSTDVSSTIVTDGFGTDVSIDGVNLVVGCLADKSFIPYAGYTGNASVLGSAYFYRDQYDVSCERWAYELLLKSFGNRENSIDNNFGRAVSIDGSTAAVTAWSDTLTRTVEFSGGSYVLENFSYESSASGDSVLGRVEVYNYNESSNTWARTSELRRNKEQNSPYNIYGYSVSVCSDFLTVGGPIANEADAGSFTDIINQNTQLSASFPSSYSGSVFVYDLNQYENGPLIGNAFYKNGYFTITNTASNYSKILTSTGSRGFELNYQGTHTIYEHEYLVSVRPGEFNYSTNPSALVQNPLAFDVNQDGVFDYQDVDLIMRYLKRKKFYDEFVFDDNGIILDQDSLGDYSWWGNDILQTESEDVLLQEGEYTQYLASSSFNAFTKVAFDCIETNLVSTNLLDIDGDGKINLNDGYILALYYFGKLNPTTLSTYTSPASTRTYVKDIVGHLDSYCGNFPFEVNPEFLGYQQSSSYDPTGSFLAPFITTIGLYDNNELVAIGKLGRPIKNLIDWPLNIIVRFDT
jgi:hypothetical protein